MDLSQRGRTMPASPIRKLAGLADAAKARGTRVYGLNIGQPDIATPPEMLEAVRGFDETVLAYGPSAGLPETRSAMARYLTNLGTPVDPSNVLVTDGGSEAILFAMAALCDPGDEIIVFEPFYTNYAGFAHITSVRLVPITTSVENGYRPPSIDRIEAAITPRTRAILYCSPSNPTGTILRRGEVRVLVDLVKKHDLFLVADEVYREFVYDGVEHVGVLEVAADAGALERVVLVDSISKRFSACGARIGFLCSPNPSVIEACLRFGQSRLCPPTIDQYAAIAGYGVIDRYVPPMIDEYRRRRDLVMGALADIEGAVCARPEGAFYVMPRIPVDDADAFAAFMLDDFKHDGATVMLATGAGFYATPGLGRDEIRIAYVLQEDHLAIAMDLLKRGIDAYNER
ncbi:MAG: pyridoxal phosphate-dependent aminotransferase [Deltaproteobacteria bacterium]|nr:pyridoxal phosphate-dependent aminotransferase [Deltaproteobacteria bacterium]